MLERLRVRGLAIGIVCAVVLPISACGGSPDSRASSMAEMDPVTIRYATLNSPESSQGKALTSFANEVEKNSDGKIKVEPYFSGSLLTADDLFSGISSGVADAGLVVPAYVPEELPVNYWLGKMGSLPSTEYPEGMLGGGAAVMNMQSNNQALRKEWSSHNLKVLYATQSNVGFDVLCTKPIDSLADAKGLRVRTPGGSPGEELEALGMVPVDMPILESYEGLQRGVIDCVNGEPAAYVSYNQRDVAKHYVPVSLSAYNMSLQAINENVWNSLPPDAQDVITEAVGRWWNTQNANYLAERQQFFDEAERYKIVIDDASKLNPVVDDYQAKAIKEVIASPPRGVADGQKFAEEYQRYLDQWTAQAKKILETQKSGSRNPVDYDYTEWTRATRAQLFNPSDS